ncbi:MAG: hypothetical protein DIU52_013890 [bacterium]|jgi:hypothetical protein|nr:MAG: hypothetical protein DIU52_15325 [bacterium]
MPLVAEDIAFSILGRSFVGRGVPEPLRGWLLAQWWRPEHALPERPYAITLEWRATDRALAPLAGEPVRALVPGRLLTWRSTGREWEWRQGGGAGVRLTLEAEAARIEAWGAVPDADLFTALYIAICEALRASGLLPLHAAVAVPPAGSVDWQPPAVPPAADEGGAMPPPAIAFLGGRGAGKSTTLVHLVRAGWTPVAEDVCWVDPEAFVVYGWDRGVRLRRPAIEAFFPDLGSAPLVPEPDGKFLLGYEHLLCCGAGRGGRGEGHGGAGRRGMLAGIVQLQRVAGQDTGWEPLSPRGAVRALWEAVGVPLGAAARQAAASWIGVVAARLPLCRLRLGPTPPASPPPW